MLLLTALVAAGHLATAQPAPGATSSLRVDRRAPAAPVVVAKKGKKKGAEPKVDKKEGAPSATGDPRGAPESATTALPLDAVRQGPAAEDTGVSRGPSRIEFDERLIQGQTNKANAIYLFERRESALRSLLKKRVDFHEEIEEALE